MEGKGRAGIYRELKFAQHWLPEKGPQVSPPTGRRSCPPISSSAYMWLWMDSPGGSSAVERVVLEDGLKRPLRMLTVAHGPIGIGLLLQPSTALVPIDLMHSALF